MPTIVPDEMKKSTRSIERPFFGPKQIRDPKELKPNLILVDGKTGSLIKIGDRPPYLDRYGLFHVDVLHKYNEHVRGWCDPQEILLADYSIEPYLDGTWNIINWLSRR